MRHGRNRPSDATSTLPKRRWQQLNLKADATRDPFRLFLTALRIRHVHARAGYRSFSSSGDQRSDRDRDASAWSQSAAPLRLDYVPSEVSEHSPLATDLLRK